MLPCASICHHIPFLGDIYFNSFGLVKLKIRFVPQNYGTEVRGDDVWIFDDNGRSPAKAVNRYTVYPPAN